MNFFVPRNMNMFSAMLTAVFYIMKVNGDHDKKILGILTVTDHNSLSLYGKEQKEHLA